MMRAADNIIGINSTVQFDSAHGPQSGIVMGFKSDLSNGQRVAVISVQGSLDNQPWHMPVDQLQRAGAGA